MKSIVKLLKPNGVCISILSDIKGLSRVRKISGVNELRFNIPEYIEDTEIDKQVENPDIKLIKYDYRISYENEVYIIRGINKKVENQEKLIEITCYSKAIQLKDRKCRVKTGIVQNGITIPAKTLSESASLLLADTTFSVGTIDISLLTNYRAIDIQTNVLDGLNKLCTYYDCIWQESNGKINFIDYKKNCEFKGLFLSDANYIKGMNLIIKEDSIITKLKIRGVNDISVNSVNNGSDSIYDFSFYMNTDYMPQPMIDALNTYNTAVSNSRKTYNTYLSELSTLQSSLITKQDELLLLKASSTNKQIEIDSAITEGKSTTTLIAELNTIKANITSKQNEIDAINMNITSKNTQIKTLNDSLDMAKYLSKEQLVLLNEFIRENEFVDDVITAKGTDITTLQELLEAAREYLSLNNQPRVDAEIDVIAFNQALDKESRIDASKLIVGSLIKIYVKKLDININCRLIEIEENFDDYKLVIKISNQKNIEDGSFKLADLFKSANDSKNFISINKDKWSQGETANNFISQNIANGINTLNTEIRNSSNTYQFNERGGVFVDKDNPNFCTIVAGKGILISTNGGVSSNIAIGKGKIFGEMIGSKIITSNTGLFNRLETYDNDNNLVCEIGNYTALDGSTQRGIGINGGSLLIKGNAPPLSFGNNITIDSTDGIQVTRSDNKVKISMDSINGIQIKTGSGNGVYGTTVLSLDSNGNATFGGIVDAKDLKIQGTSVLTSSNLIKGSSISADSLYVNSANITGTIVADEIRGNVAKLASGVSIGNIYSTEEKTLTFYNGGTQGNTCRIRANANGSLSINGNQAVYLGHGGGTQIELSEGQVKLNGTVTGLESSSFNQPHHNHGISNGTRLAICDTTGKVTGSILWVESGGFTHDHIIY